MIKIYDEIGPIELVPNSRSKSVIVRYRDGVLRLTHPTTMKEEYLDEIILKMKSRIIKLKEKAPLQTFFTTDYTLNTYTFDFLIKEENREQIQFILKQNKLYMLCPFNTDFNSEGIQNRIKNTVIQVMRNEAKRIFPDWINTLATKHNFKYKSIKINSSKSRWGSCSSVGNINISLYCLLLPKHLIELVILHELCHTIEMNHSNRFWSLLDKVTEGKANELTAELKTVKTAI